MDTTTIAALAGAVGALVGAIVGAITTLFNSWLQGRSEERKQYRQLIIQAALENYKEERAMARKILETHPHKDQYHYPLDDYIIHMTLLADRLILKKPKADEIVAILKELDDMKSKVRAFHADQAKQKVRLIPKVKDTKDSA